MSSRNALVIDDEPDMTTYLATLLADNGWTVRTANSAAEGLALAKQQVPDIVLLDLMMPERGGLSMLIELRKTDATSAVPIVVVSGMQDTLTGDYGDIHTFLKRMKHRQPDAFLDKPIDPDGLLKTLDELTSPAAE